MKKICALCALVAVVAALALMAGCSKGTKVEKPLVIRDRIKIAIVSPQTGDQAKIGQDLRDGGILAVNEANEKGGIAGLRVQAVAQDGRHDPREANIVASQLVSDPAVGAVVGHLNSSCSMPAGDIYFKAGMLQISPASTNPDISHRGYVTFFRTCATDAVQAPSAADFAYKTLGKRRFAILHDKTTYGEGLAKQFRGQVQKLKARALIYEGITQGDTDYNAVLARVKSVNPDMIYFGGMYPEGALLAKQAKEMGLNAPFAGADGIMDIQYVKLGGKATEGCYGTFLSPSPEQMPAAAAFVKSYEKAFRPVGPYSPYAYDAANMAMEAIGNAIKKDGKKTAQGIEVPRKSIIAELRAIRDFPGVTGKINFDQFGDPVNQVIYMYVIKNGEWVCLGPARK